MLKSTSGGRGLLTQSMWCVSVFMSHSQGGSVALRFDRSTLHETYLLTQLEAVVKCALLMCFLCACMHEFVWVSACVCVCARIRACVRFFVHGDVCVFLPPDLVVCSEASRALTNYPC